MARSRIRLGATAVVLLITFFIPAPSRAYTPTTYERYAHANLNGARTYTGRRALSLHTTMSYCAHRHSVAMATRSRLYHSSCSNYRENVGYASTLDSVLRAMLSSTAHRANILCSCSRVAVGVAYSNYRWYVTEIYW